MFKLRPSERLSRWKSFRKELDALSIESAMVRILDFWSSCPFIPFYLNTDDVANWPNPWQLIEENYYCDLAKVLGIIYTAHLTSHSPYLVPEIRIYIDSETEQLYHIAYFCHGKYVLNLIEGEIVNKAHINQKLKLIRCYTAKDLKLEEY